MLGITTPVTVPDDDYTEIFVVWLGDAPQQLLLHYARFDDERCNPRLAEKICFSLSLRDPT
jgi:hypothetical protein